MLKLVSASGDLDDSLSGFSLLGKILSQGRIPVPVEVNMGAIEKALAFCDRSWRFLVEPLSPSARTVYTDVLLSCPDDLLVHRPLPKKRLEVGGHAVVDRWFPRSGGNNGLLGDLSLGLRLASFLQRLML